MAGSKIRVEIMSRIRVPRMERKSLLNWVNGPRCGSGFLSAYVVLRNLESARTDASELMLLPCTSEILKSFI
jgi:hypothetical protein